MPEDCFPCVALVGFTSIAVLTWFFSYWPRLFVRVFVPSESLRGAARGILRDPEYARGMRTMAVLQFLVGSIVSALAWWLG